jgi:enoyl-CoA hydratase
MAKTRDAAKKIAGKGPLAIASVKRTMARGVDAPLPTATELEASAFATLFGSEDQREGMRAFLEKKAATFRGK